MDNFQKLSLLERKKLTLEELREYYKKHRKFSYENNLKIKNLKIKKAFYPVLRSLFSIKRNFIGQKINVLNDDRNEIKDSKLNKSNENRPIIFAINHVGKYDIEIIAEALNEHTYILMGDPEQLYRTIEGMFLELNGVVYLEVNDKDDCDVAKKTIIRLLKNNMNIMWYPEGIWNLDENLIVLPFRHGIIDAALQSNALIVPVGLEQKDKDFYISIGSAFDVYEYKTDYVDDRELKIKCCEMLRSLMATELWKIWEHFGVSARTDINRSYYDNYVNDRLSEWPEFTIEDIQTRIYQKPGIVNINDIQKGLTKVKYDKHNAFLLNKRHFY